MRRTPLSWPALPGSRRPALCRHGWRRSWPTLSKRTEEAVAAGNVRLAIWPLFIASRWKTPPHAAPILFPSWRTKSRGVSRAVCLWLTPNSANRLAQRHLDARRAARLRILLCDRAFEAGFEVTNLLELRRTVSALAEVLGTDDTAGLSALRLLWSQRPTRPWDQCGEARTVFDLAGDPGVRPFIGRASRFAVVAARADVGCSRRGRRGADASGGNHALRWRRLVARCAVYRGADRGGGNAYRASAVSLALGKTSTPRALGKSTLWPDGWNAGSASPSRISSQTAGVAAWRAPEQVAVPARWGAARCPECGRHILGRVGEIGVMLDASS